MQSCQMCRWPNQVAQEESAAKQAQMTHEGLTNGGVAPEVTGLAAGKFAEASLSDRYLFAEQFR